MKNKKINWGVLAIAAAGVAYAFGLRPHHVKTKYEQAEQKIKQLVEKHVKPNKQKEINTEEGEVNHYGKSE